MVWYVDGGEADAEEEVYYIISSGVFMLCLIAKSFNKEVIKYVTQLRLFYLFISFLLLVFGFLGFHLTRNFASPTSF